MALARQHIEPPMLVQSDSSTTLSILSADGLDRPAYGHLAAEIKALLIDSEFTPKNYIWIKIGLQTVWQDIAVLSATCRVAA